MADSDYTTRGTGPITPTAYLSGTIGPGAGDPVQFYGFSSATGVLPSAGAAAMIGDEIVKVLTIVDGEMTLARGCADTIPQAHAAKSIIYFLDDAVGTDSREYMATETVGVKLLMRTNGAAMPLRSSPPNALTFNSRFARPYPPGNLLVDGSPWHAQKFPLNSANPALSISWAHRDRVTQDDQLFGHEYGNIGPEPGTTYRARVYAASAPTVAVRTIDIPTGTAFEYTLSQGITDLLLVPGVATPTEGIIKLVSLRDGFESLQPYSIHFMANAGALLSGWGNGWGLGWGN